MDWYFKESLYVFGHVTLDGHGIMGFYARDTLGTLKERKLSVVLVFCTTRHINVMCTHVAHKT